MRKPSRFVWKLAAALVVLCFFLFACFAPTPPIGKFHVPGLTGGKCCWEFHEGDFIEWIYPEDGPSSTTTVQRRVMGKYQQQGNEWIIIGPKGPEMRAQATLFSLRLSNMDGSWSAEYKRCW
jgi:hypothetical protein